MISDCHHRFESDSELWSDILCTKFPDVTDAALLFLLICLLKRGYYGDVAIPSREANDVVTIFLSNLQRFQLLKRKRCHSSHMRRRRVQMFSHVIDHAL